MNNCCDICVDMTCGGKKNCNCDRCEKRQDCYRLAGLKPTVRITRKCTQSCRHCCFACTPNETEMMTTKTAVKVNTFSKNNNIKRMEIMGGEFFCNPDWKSVIHTLVDGLTMVRLVSNGDWAATPGLANEVVTFIKSHPNIYLGISKDQWHTNKHVDAANAYLVNADIPVRVATKEQTSENSIVPVGRGDMVAGVYSMLACYCHNPEKRYSFLIDEIGVIHKCGMGAWPYATIDNFQNGGFANRFKSFNTKFYDAFIMSCAQCQRCESHSKKIDLTKR